MIRASLALGLLAFGCSGDRAIQVVDENSNPIAGTRWAGVRSEGVLHGSSDAEGRVVLPGEDDWYAISADGFVPILLARESADDLVRLTRGGAISGRLLVANGVEFDDFRVVIEGDALAEWVDSEIGVALGDLSDDGSFSEPFALPAGDYRVSVRLSGERGEHAPTWITVRAGERAEVPAIDLVDVFRVVELEFVDNRLHPILESVLRVTEADPGSANAWWNDEANLVRIVTSRPSLDAVCESDDHETVRLTVTYSQQIVLTAKP